LGPVTEGKDLIIPEASIVSKIFGVVDGVNGVVNKGIQIPFRETAINILSLSNILLEPIS